MTLDIILKSLKSGIRVGGTPYKNLKLLGRGGYSAVVADPRNPDLVLKLTPVNESLSKEDTIEARALNMLSGVYGVVNITGPVFSATMGKKIKQKVLALPLEKLAGSPVDELTSTVPYPLLGSLAYTLLEMSNRSIVHGDIKPSNIMVHEHYPTLIDFGSATLPNEPTKRPFGSPGYVSPEHITGNLSTGSDLFCYGILAVELLTGNPCFPASLAVCHHYTKKNRDEILKRIKEPLMQEVLADALHPSQAHRNQSARVVYHEVDWITGW